MTLQIQVGLTNSLSSLFYKIRLAISESRNRILIPIAKKIVWIEKMDTILCCALCWFLVAATLLN
jgi:hypothetical protein